jgi:hypothetical protein
MITLISIISFAKKQKIIKTKNNKNIKTKKQKIIKKKNKKTKTTKKKKEGI